MILFGKPEIHFSGSCSEIPATFGAKIGILAACSGDAYLLWRLIFS
jgi:hypothetical protein